MENVPEFVRQGAYSDPAVEAAAVEALLEKCPFQELFALLALSGDDDQRKIVVNAISRIFGSSRAPVYFETTASDFVAGLGHPSREIREVTAHILFRLAPRTAPRLLGPELGLLQPLLRAVADREVAVARQVLSPLSSFK